MADRPRPNGGDFGWKYELASGDECPLASLRTGRVSRSMPCRAENGKPTPIGTRASLHRPGDCSQWDKRDSLCFRPAIIRFKEIAASRRTREHFFFRAPFQLQLVPRVPDQPFPGGT